MILRDELAQALKIRPEELPDIPSFSGVSTDSRQVRPGQVFVALRGERFDGHDFVMAALKGGACLAIVESAWNAPMDRPGPILRVPDTLQALQRLARAHRMDWPGSLVAVTGSNGKTTTKEMTAAVLGTRYRVHRNRGNLNNHIGLPLTLLDLGEEHEWAVTEMGMNHPGEIDLLASLAAPSIAVVTNAGTAHLEGLGSIENVIRAKLELLKHTEGPVVVHGDNPGLVAESRARARGRVVTFGFGPGVDLRASRYRGAGGRSFFALDGGFQAELPVPGMFNVLNALAALAVGDLAGVSREAALDALKTWEPAAMRFELVTVGSSRIVNDAYNANPDSMKASLAAFAALAEQKAMNDSSASAGSVPRKVAVLGAMNELGPESPRLHRELGEEARKAGMDLVVGIGDAARDTVAGFGQPSAWYPTAAEASKKINEWYRPGDMILLKGSRTLVVETVLGGIRDAA